jgi:hypothetical protein
VRDTRAGAGEVQLQYLTGGLSWSAEHTLVRTGETTATWAAVVQVQNTTRRSYTDARVKLLAGDVSRVPTNEMMPKAAMMRVSAMADAAGEAPAEQSFADYHLYTLPGTVTLRDRESQTLVLLEPRAITVTPRYVYRRRRGRRALEARVRELGRARDRRAAARGSRALLCARRGSPRTCSSPARRTWATPRPTRR